MSDVRGFLLAAAMIYEWIAASTCDHLVNHMQSTYLRDVVMFPRQVIFQAITLVPHIDQLVTSTISQEDSNILTQLYCHYWEVNNIPQCT